MKSRRRKGERVFFAWLVYRRRSGECILNVSLLNLTDLAEGVRKLYFYMYIPLLNLTNNLAEGAGRAVCTYLYSVLAARHKVERMICTYLHSIIGLIWV